MNDNYNVPYNSDGETYIKAQTVKLLRDLRYYIEIEGKTDFQTRTIIMHALESNKFISELEDSEYKEELMLILFYDMMDVLSTARGLNLSPDRVDNYKAKVVSFNKILDLKFKDLDLSNLKEMLANIESKMEESLAKTHAIDPSVWFLIQTFVNTLMDRLLLDEEKELKEHLVSVYKKDNLLYNLILNGIDTYIENNKKDTK